MKADIQAKEDLFNTLIKYQHIKVAILNTLEFSIKAILQALIAARENNNIIFTTEVR